MKPLGTSRDVADSLGVSAESVRVWAAKGLIPTAARAGERGRRLFDIDAVRKALTPEPATQEPQAVQK